MLNMIREQQKQRAGKEVRGEGTRGTRHLREDLECHCINGLWFFLSTKRDPREGSKQCHDLTCISKGSFHIWNCFILKCFYFKIFKHKSWYNTHIFCTSLINCQWLMHYSLYIVYTYIYNSIIIKQCQTMHMKSFILTIYYNQGI